MKVQMLVLFFLLLCAQFLSTMSLESKEEKTPINVNVNDFSKEDGLMQHKKFSSKVSKAKGSNGGQNDHAKKNNAISMFMKPRTYVQDVGIGVIVLWMIFVFKF
ncbi:hypothetical protein QVD17_34928 [Tagetes erecta]|uniref:Uncharacterized protein n=1 Tax=Tagetes erecta TaxID=13708 RepID=A0AAD8NER4_TARER|nr:hypothetical protein QVD17_34928 [Tagetes erecta]